MWKIADHAKGLCQLGAFVHVDLADEDILALLGDLVHHGGEHTAGAAPVGVEVEQDGLFLGLESLKALCIDLLYGHGEILLSLCLVPAFVPGYR